MLRKRIKKLVKNIKEKLTAKHILHIGLALIGIGVVLLMSDYLYTKKIKIFEEMNYKIYINTTKKKSNAETASNSDNTLDASQIDSNAKTEYSSGIYDYVAMLEIPKVDLKRGLVAKNSKYNNVNRNIMTLKESTYPNVEKGNLILAAHSGSGYISFFKNLYKLKVKDIANVYYNNVKYTYEITNIYLQDKVGHLYIYRDRNKTTLTLITCTKNNKKKQTVYIAELVSQVEY